VIIDKIAKSNNEIIKEKKKQNIDLEIIRKREGTKLENLRVEKNKLISSKGFQVLSLPLKGEIKTTLEPRYYHLGATSNDSILYKIVLIDRSLNISNELITPIITR
jgi:hypothetical protein